MRSLISWFFICLLLGCRRVSEWAVYRGCKMELGWKLNRWINEGCPVLIAAYSKISLNIPIFFPEIRKNVTKSIYTLYQIYLSISTGIRKSKFGIKVPHGYISGPYLTFGNFNILSRKIGSITLKIGLTYSQSYLGLI